MILISLALLIVGLITANDTLIIASGLFGIASSIDNFWYGYFKNKNRNP